MRDASREAAALTAGISRRVAYVEGERQNAGQEWRILKRDEWHSELKATKGSAGVPCRDDGD